jgi:hypothetical protein
MPVLDRDSDYTIASDQNYLIEIRLGEWEIGKAWFLTFHHHIMWRASCLSLCWELELGHHSRNLGGIGLLDLLVCWADSGFVGKRGWVNGSYTRTHGT